MGRIFILGIDGGEFRVIDHLSSCGQIPNIDGLMREGTRKSLLSTTPPLTPAAWASFYTGTNPGRHGVIDFLARRVGSYKLVPVHRSMVNGETLWQTAAGAGLKSLIVNLPMTYPPEAISGWMVSGMDTPGPHNQYTFPPSLKEEITGLFPRYRPDVHVSRHTLKHEPDLRRWYMKEVLDLEESRRGVIGHLMENRPWNIAVAVLVAADRLQHVFWNRVEEAMERGDVPPPSDPAGSVFEAYKMADRFLGRLKNSLAPEDHLMIISDHGFGPLDKDVNLNALLADLGFLKFKRPPFAPSLRRSLERRAKTILPGRLRDFLWRHLPPPEAKRLEGLGVLEETIDWKNTRAYAFGYLGGIFLNLRGREPEGIVDPNDYGPTVEELASALSTCRDPEDGAPLISHAHRRDDLYRGPRIDSLPDLVLTLKDHRCTTRHSFGSPGGPVFSKPQEDFGPLSHTGSHRPAGILIGAGPRFRGKIPRDKADIIDIMPTCLDLLGIEAPGHLDGRSLLCPATPGEEKISPEYNAEGDKTLKPSLSESEEKEVLDNLRNLGYF